MAQPYVGEIRMFGGNFAPLGWQFCDGSLLPISENETLFQLIGTTYGGDGQSTFAVPDLRGRAPIHMGAGPGINWVIGEQVGTETVTLTLQQLPQHSHVPVANSAPGNSDSPSGTAWAKSGTTTQFAATANTPMAANAAANTGGGQPHENMPPYLAISFIISLFGIFPSPT